MQRRVQNAKCKVQNCVVCDGLAGLLWCLLRGFLFLVRSRG